MDVDELTVLLAQNSDSSDSEVLPSSLNPYEEEIRVMGQSEEHKNNWRRDLNGPIFSLTILSALGGFLFGYDTGVVSGAMLQIQDDPRINPDTFWTELIVSVTLGSAWLFALIGGPSTDYFGRKLVILAASVVFMAGAIVMGIAESKEVLLVGRVIIGAGIGLASMSVPMYISESAPPNYRGFLVTCNNLVITGGQFFAACVCGFFSKVEPNGWKYMLGLAGIPSFLQFVGFLFMPESPRWLVSKGKIEKARQVLTKIRANTSIDPEEELEEIKRAVEMEETTTNTIDTVSRIFRTPSARRPLVLGCLLQIFQQVAGINTVMYYSATIITMAGFSNTSQAIWMSAGVASINFLCTFIALPLVERIGRRKLLLASLFGVTLSLVLLGVGFQVTYIDTPKVTINATVDDFCNKYSDCASCTYDTLCGYCFQMPPKDSDSVAVNASCEMKSEEDDGYSKIGRCIKDNVEAETVIYATDYCPSDFSWLVVFGLCLYLFFFAPGMGPMPWTINSEIYPTWARSSSQSIATSMNWAFNLLVSMTFLSLTEAITKQGTFYLYTGIAFIGFVIFYKILPETKGKTLEEMEAVFTR